MDWGIFRPSKATVVCLFLLAFSFALMTLRFTQSVSGLRAVLFYWVSPSQEAANHALEFAGGLGGNLSELVRAHSENRALRDSMRRLSSMERQYEEVLAENERLKRMLEVKASAPFSSLAASVSGRDAQSWTQALWVDRGSKEGVEPDSAVAALHQDESGVLLSGVVGRIVECGYGTSKLLLISDPLSSVAAVLPRTGEQGLLQGQGSFQTAVEYLDAGAEVQPGDEVLTSGLGGIFPKGLLIGRVSRVDVTQSGFKRAAVKPAVPLNRIREVLIYKRQEQPQAPAEAPS